MSSTSHLRTKVCHIVKRANFEEYGFNLHSEKIKPGQYIGKVDPLSPAEIAGLKEGDRIIEVNGVNISQESHKQVVQRIKAISNEVRLLIVVNASKEFKSVSEVPSKVPDIHKSYHIDKNITGDSVIKQESSDLSTNINNIRVISADIGTNQQQITDFNTNNVNEILLRQQGVIIFPSTTFYTTSPKSVTTTPTNSNKTPSGGLDLRMTAAEMREKLLSKKKYDPKNEIVDLRRKFEIIQKL